MPSFVAAALRNRVSALGVALTTASAVVLLFFLALELFGYVDNPYAGLVVFGMLPVLFVAGLLLIPFGLWLGRRRGGVTATRGWPTLDLSDVRVRRTLIFVLVATLVNVGIVAVASYGAVEYTESREFCGEVCHVPMKPEFVAHQFAPHANVACARCHVAPGATGFFEAKLSGISRVAAMARGSYPRPIPPPTGELIPARDTCEGCHWPERVHGDVVKRVAEYGTDEANTETVTTVRLHVGGGSERLGVATGIHWHMNVANQIDYVAADAAFQTVLYVRLQDRRGAVREYFAPGATPEQIRDGHRRQMDCMDCHNRPAHPIATSASRAVDERIARAEIPKDLPFVKREAVKALEAAHPDDTAALAAIAEALGGFYRSSYPAVHASRAADVERAVRAVQSIYRQNVFPEMQVTFGTYVNNIGHVETPGCFRCHDEEKATKDGRKIGQDCELCHSIE